MRFRWVLPVDSRRDMKIVSLILAVLLCVPVFADDTKKAPFALTEKESKDISAAFADYQDASKLLDEAVKAIKSAKTDTDIVPAGWKFQSAQNRIEFTGAILNSLVTSLRTKYKCEDCILDKDFKNLIEDPNKKK